jgi:hypothetical protein
MKEQTGRNLESPKVAEVKAIFAEIGKTPGGEVLASVFQDNTLARTWEIEYNTVYGHTRIYGKTQEENSHLMVLTKYPHPRYYYRTAELEIFKNEKRVQEGKRDVRFCVKSPSGEIKMDIENLSLTTDPEYVDYLMKIIGEIRTKISQIPKKDETRNFRKKES